MSDLQCAARFLLVPAGVPAESVRGERAAMLYDGRTSGAELPLATHLGVPCRRTEGPVHAAEVRRPSEAVCAISDLHRGETVVLVLDDLADGEVHEVLVDGDGTTHRRLR